MRKQHVDSGGTRSRLQQIQVWMQTGKNLAQAFAHQSMVIDDKNFHESFLR